VIGTILVALDGSERAAGVLSTAVRLAEVYQATLHLLRVIQIPPEFPAAASYGSQGDALPPLLERRALDDLRALLLGEPRAQQSRLHVRSGVQVWRTIIDAADEMEVDLIVLGTHGYHGVDRILGTTAGNVVNLARKSVLVAHVPRRAGPFQPPPRA
jgi:nucleotide-binding universal stress UspA family protein